ncbi:unnamed protein product, partial [Tuber aestivum]
MRWGWNTRRRMDGWREVRIATSFTVLYCNCGIHTVRYGGVQIIFNMSIPGLNSGLKRKEISGGSCVAHVFVFSAPLRYSSTGRLHSTVVYHLINSRGSSPGYDIRLRYYRDTP